jgi:hypothetical protein
MHLTRRDCADIQAHIDLACDRFDRHGLMLRASDDMQAFVDYISGEEHSFGASASHDPAHSYLTPGTSFWVYLEEKKTGVKVGSCAQKLIVTKNFAEDLLSHTLYESKVPTLHHRMLDFHDGTSEEDLGLAGNIVYGSGLYLHPNYRGMGLLILSRISRTIALRFFKADHFVGIQRLTGKSRRKILERQRFAHVRAFAPGMPGKWDGDFQIAWSSRSEWLAAIRQELLDAETRRQASSRRRDGHRAAGIALGNRV